MGSQRVRHDQETNISQRPFYMVKIPKSDSFPPFFTKGMYSRTGDVDYQLQKS